MINFLIDVFLDGVATIMAIATGIRFRYNFLDPECDGYKMAISELEWIAMTTMIWYFGLAFYWKVCSILSIENDLIDCIIQLFFLLLTGYVVSKMWVLLKMDSKHRPTTEEEKTLISRVGLIAASILIVIQNRANTIVILAFILGLFFGTDVDSWDVKTRYISFCKQIRYQNLIIESFWFMLGFLWTCIVRATIVILYTLYHSNVIVDILYNHCSYLVAACLYCIIEIPVLLIISKHNRKVYNATKKLYSFDEDDE